MQNKERKQYIISVAAKKSHDLVFAIGVRLYYLKSVKRAERNDVKKEQHYVYRCAEIKEEIEKPIKII